MSKKLIFSAIIAIVFISAMIIYRNTMTFVDIVLAFIGASGTIGTIWSWISMNEITQQNKVLEKENITLKMQQQVLLNKK